MAAAPDPLPHDPWPGATLSCLRLGQGYVADRFQRFSGDAFRTRILLTPILCLKGPEAAALLTAPGHVTRASPPLFAIPHHWSSLPRAEGPEHAQRKSLLLSLLQPQACERMAAGFAAHWLKALPDWSRQGELEIAPAIRPLLIRAALDWLGIRDFQGSLDSLAEALAASGRKAGLPGLGGLRRHRHRRALRRWAATQIRLARAQSPASLSGASPLTQLAQGPPKAAAQMLLGLLHGVLTVAPLIGFAALMIAQFPQEAAILDEAGGADAFMAELCRMLPVVPAVAGRARKDLVWRGHRIRQGAWVLLDLNATQRDPGQWPEPHSFRPRRFLADPSESPPGPLLSHGAGPVVTGHRCPGEALSLALLRRAVLLLHGAMSFELPRGEGLDLRLIPPLPAEGIRLCRVQERVPSSPDQA